MLFEDKVSKAFADEVKAIGKRLNIVPDYLMAVMGFETGMTFSPSVKNPLSSATGLIQFMAATAVGMGTTVSALASMTAVAQLAYVEKYMASQQKAHGALKTLTDVYLAVFYPAAIGKPNTYSFTPEVSRVNAVFDKDHNGIVTKQEILNTITDWVTVRGGIIDEVTKYNNVYIAVTTVGVAVMLTFFGVQHYYPHLLRM